MQLCDVKHIHEFSVHLYNKNKNKENARTNYKHTFVVFRLLPVAQLQQVK